MDDRELSPFEQGIEIGFLLATTRRDYGVSELARKVGKRRHAMGVALRRCRVARLQQIVVNGRPRFKYAEVGEEE